MRVARRHCRAVSSAIVGLSVLLVQTTPPSPAGSDTPMQVHEVKRGDTLSAIARRNHISVAALVRANHLSSEKVTLRIGQRLVIPPSPPGSASPRLPVVAREVGVSAGEAAPAALPPAPESISLAVPDFGEQSLLFAWPVDGAVSSTFGRRRTGWHRGIDILAEHGTPVLAAAPGVVIASGVERRYGRVVKIEHSHGFVTVYAHNDQNMVEIGDRVSTGQMIAVIGRTGRATAHHLHFEIRQGELAYNPLYLLPLPPRVAFLDEVDAAGPEEFDE